MPALYELKNLGFAYGGREGAGAKVLTDLSLEIEAGARWAIIGPSGCGKSTLLHLLAGLARPAEGVLLYRGAPLAHPQPSIQIILQVHGLFPWKRVIDNVILPLQLAEGRSKDQAPKALALFDRLGLSGLEQRYPYELSGGQQQRVAIARALISRPSVLLMDEPFSALDALTREDLQALALELIEAEQITSVLVTHQIMEAVRMADHLLVFPAFGEKPLALTVDQGVRYDESAFARYCSTLRGLLKGAGDAI